MNPKEFQERWDNVEPAVLATVQQICRETPLGRGPTSADDQRAIDERGIRWSRARPELAKLLREHGLTMFEQWPSWLRYENAVDNLVDFIRRAARYKSCVDENLQADVMSQDWKVVRINAPTWFDDPEFMKWLNRPGTATWHRPGTAPGDYSDVFFTFCQGEGSDYPGSEDPGIPEEIWKHLEFIVAEQHDWEAEVLIWVSNLK